MVNMRPFTAFEQKNLKFLVNHNVKFTQVEITPTGLVKGILDSTAPMRAYFLEEGVHDYSEQLQGQKYKQMRNAGIRVTLDDRSESMNYKIRESLQDKKIPYVCVIGDKEIEANAVAVRKRGVGQVGTVSVDEFIANIEKEIKDRA